MVAGKRVYERVGGSGPLVVLVHGVGVSGRYMLPTAGRLVGRCRVVVPDLPGFGGSERLGRRVDVARLAGFLAESLEGPAAVVGNSFGCQVAVELAVRRPELVRQLVLVGPTADPEARSVRQQALRLVVDACREPAQLGALQAFDYVVHVAKSGLSGLRELVDDRIEDRLPHVAAPAVVVRGERDPIVPHAWAARVAAALPQGRLVEVRGSGHAVNYAASDALAEIVLELVA